VFWEAVVWKYFIALSALLIVSVPASVAQEIKAPEKAADAEFKVPPEIAKEANPVKPTPESIAQGKKKYGIDCSMCHGKSGDGKGDLAGDMNLKLPDFQDPGALKDKTDGELFYIIQKGKGQMPSEGDRAKKDEIWNLVNYIHSLAKKEPSQKEKP
jgi:mono/diheme cytochrome c family protein